MAAYGLAKRGTVVQVERRAAEWGQYGGRIVVFLCTNRLSVVDPALQRRAAINRSRGWLRRSRPTSIAIPRMGVAGK